MQKAMEHQQEVHMRQLREAAQHGAHLQAQLETLQAQLAASERHKEEVAHGAQQFVQAEASKVDAEKAQLQA